MARKRQHPHIGKYIVRYEHPVAVRGPTDAYDTPEQALDATQSGMVEDDVVYVYQVVAVKRISKPTIAEDYLP